MMTRLLIFVLLTTGCLSLSPSLRAQESREENRAARCSAIFTMLAEVFPDDARAPVFRRFIGVSNDLYLQEKNGLAAPALRMATPAGALC